MAQASQVLQLPPDVLKQIPAGTPPPGVVPNFTDPEDLGYVLITVATVFVFLGLVAFAIRAYGRIYVLKRLRWDDAVLTLGLLGMLVTYVGNIWGCVDGPCGKHMWDTSLFEELRKVVLIANFLNTCFLSPALCCIKLALYMMYYQIFWPMRWLRICVYIGATVTTCTYIAISIYLFVFQVPRPGIPWVVWVLSPEQIKSLAVSIPTGGIGIATDITLLLLPIPAVMGLQLPTKKKLGVLAVFATGLLAVVASIVGTYYRVRQIQTKDYHWYTVRTECLIQIEMNVGIICASMPIISKVFAHHLPTIQSYRSRAQSRIAILRSRKSQTQLSDSHTDMKEPSYEEMKQLQKLQQKLGGVGGVRVQHSEEHVEYPHVNGVDYV